MENHNDDYDDEFAVGVSNEKNRNPTLNLVSF